MGLVETCFLTFLGTTCSLTVTVIYCTAVQHVQSGQLPGPDTNNFVSKFWPVTINRKLLCNYKVYIKLNSVASLADCFMG